MGTGRAHRKVALGSARDRQGIVDAHGGIAASRHGEHEFSFVASRALTAGHRPSKPMSDPIDRHRRRRPDHEREPDEDAARDLDDVEIYETSSRQLGLLDDEEDMFSLSLDDLRDMEGPDA
jgi:hypothetical protein